MNRKEEKNENRRKEADSPRKDDSAREAGLRYCEAVFQRFYEPGSLEDGGVTRLGYTETEDEMHRIFRELGEELDLAAETDAVGNTILWNREWADSPESPCIMMGSHLDSVVEGGRYDGVAGIIAGLLTARQLREENIRIPFRIAAFRCEESSSFGHATIGSGLVTGQLKKEEVENASGRDGAVLSEVFRKRGYSMEPRRIRGIRAYLEVHIEQGRVLEDRGCRIGIVTKIAGPRRYNFYIGGMAEHSGATPMGLRKDALCGAAELILEIERIGREESGFHTVATASVIENSPNALNVVPGAVKTGLDLRGIDKESLDRAEKAILAAAEAMGRKRGLTVSREKTAHTDPVALSGPFGEKLLRCAESLGLSRMAMPSGAGHDAMYFPGLCETGLIFIPCEGGISHNKKEFTDLENIYNGASVCIEYIRREWDGRK